MGASTTPQTDSQLKATDDALVNSADPTAHRPRNVELRAHEVGPSLIDLEVDATANVQATIMLTPLGSDISDEAPVAETLDARYDFPVLSARTLAQGQWLSLSLAVLVVGAMLAYWARPTEKVAVADDAKVDRLYVAIK
jgi:hypothetical protein